MATVCCKLPNGIVIELGDKKVALNGVNKSAIIGATHGSTEVNDDFWKAWVEKHKEYPPYKSGAIFAGKNQNEAAAVAKDLEEVTTGLEPMKKKGDKRAAGVLPADEKK
jgi:hypothetical protein